MSSHITAISATLFCVESIRDFYAKNNFNNPVFKRATAIKKRRDFHRSEMARLLNCFKITLIALLTATFQT
jgi:hypothetical protein